MDELKGTSSRNSLRERINSQAKDFGIERPKARNIRSIRRLNTLIDISINAKALQRARAINARLLMAKLAKVAWPQAGIQHRESRQWLTSPLASRAEGTSCCPSVPSHGGLPE